MNEHNISVEDARAELDTEIAALEARLQTLKARRNDLSPTAKLPDELLEAIFKICKTREQSRKSRRMNLRWIKVSLVSRRWHSIAVGAASLWDTVDCGWPKGALQAVLKRSGSCPLLFYGKTSKDNEKQVMLILSHSSRLRVINVIVDCEHMKWFVDMTSHYTAPLLEEISLGSFQEEWGGEVCPDLFKGDIPSLQRVQLSGYNLDFNMSILSSLTDLKLHYLYDVNIRLSCTVFLDALAACPNLVKLSLNDACPSPATNRPRRARILKSLECINIYDDHDHVAHFIPYLDTTRIKKLDITIVIGDEDELTSFSQSLPTLASHLFVSLVNTTCHDMELDGQDEYEYELRWNRNHPFEYEYDSFLSLRGVGYGQTLLVAKVQEAFRILGSAIPSNYIEDLRLRHGSIRSGDLVAALGHFSKLDQLTLEAYMTRVVIGATRGALWCLENVPEFEGTDDHQLTSGWKADGPSTLASSATMIMFRGFSKKDWLFKHKNGIDSLLDWHAFMIARTTPLRHLTVEETLVYGFESHELAHLETIDGIDMFNGCSSESEDESDDH